MRRAEKVTQDLGVTRRLVEVREAMDCSPAAGACARSGPRWIRDHFQWGPCRWPIYWCDLPLLDTLDCGVFSVLAREAFSQRGVTSLPAQLIQQFSLQDAGHWRARWIRATGHPPDWVLDDLAYHEACAVVIEENACRIWDPTNNWWIDDAGLKGYETTLAVRIWTEGYGAPGEFLWGTKPVRPGEWVRLT